MNISSAKSPYLLQVERSNRPKATYGNRFRIALDEEKAESQVTETAEEEEAVTKYNDEEAEAAGKTLKSEEEEEKEEEENKVPCYTIKDEEAEYFLEKYGEKFNEDTVQELYYELADKGIVSRNDAGNASGVLEIMPLSAARSITYMGPGPGYGLEKYLNDNRGFVSDKVYVKDVSRTDKNSPYKKLWESFRKTYDRSIDTWEDALQENIDFERYVKENKPDADYLFRQHSDSVIEGLEKTKDVITRIFGEVTL